MGQGFLEEMVNDAVMLLFGPLNSNEFRCGRMTSSVWPDGQHHPRLAGPFLLRCRNTKVSGEAFRHPAQRLFQCPGLFSGRSPSRRGTLSILNRNITKRLPKAAECQVSATLHGEIYSTIPLRKVGNLSGFRVRIVDPDFVIRIKDSDDEPGVPGRVYYANGPPHDFVRVGVPT